MMESNKEILNYRKNVLSNKVIIVNNLTNFNKGN